LLHRAKPEPTTTEPADQGRNPAAELTRARTRTWVLLGITAAQGVVGYVQYFTGLPELLVGLHLFAAAVLIASVTFTITGLRVREPAPARMDAEPLQPA